MSLLSLIKGVNGTVVSDLEALVPTDMKSELGNVAHAFVANIKYDFTKAKADIAALTSTDIAAVWAAVKETVASLLSNPQLAATLVAGTEVAVSPNAQTVSNFETALVASTKVLQSTAATVLIPALKNIGSSTLTSMTTTAGSMVASGVIAVQAAAANTAAPATK